MQTQTLQNGKLNTTEKPYGLKDFPMNMSHWKEAGTIMRKPVVFNLNEKLL